MSDNPSQCRQPSGFTYPILLTISTALSVLFCFLYITKPTTAKEAVTGTHAHTPPTTIHSEVTTSATEPASSAKDDEFIAPSADHLPGDVPSTKAPLNTAASSQPLPVTASTKNNVSWEETNDRIQHVIMAEHSGGNERVLIEVPVIYQTRAMRWGPDEIREARRILRALEIYRSRINKLNEDGKNIQMAWNQLLRRSQPTGALRADSPSLPLSDTANTSATAITIEN